MKRLLNCVASDFAGLDREGLLAAIRASEGRVIMAENVTHSGSALPEVTNAELVRAFGADLILMNTLDVLNPDIPGLDVTENKIARLKELTGRPIGVNLEPIDLEVEMLEARLEINEGRQVNAKTVQALNDNGFDFVCITGNPGAGITNKTIEEAIRFTKNIFKGVIIAGKMHGAGSKEAIFDEEALLSFADAGADIVLIPSPGSVPGSSIEECSRIVKKLKAKGVMTVGGLGTSQESSDVATIKQIGLMNKMVGFDIHHIGDAGFGGLAPLENIFELSVAVRGKRHTYKMIGTSIRR